MSVATSLHIVNNKIRTFCVILSKRQAIFSWIRKSDLVNCDNFAIDEVSSTKKKYNQYHKQDQICQEKNKYLIASSSRVAIF